MARAWLGSQCPRYPHWDDAALGAHIDGFAFAPHLDKPSIAYLCQALAQSAAQPGRIVLVAHYEALPGVPWQAVVELA